MTCAFFNKIFGREIHGVHRNSLCTGDDRAEDNFSSLESRPPLRRSTTTEAGSGNKPTQLGSTRQKMIRASHLT